MTTNYTVHYRLALPDFQVEPWHDAVHANTQAVDNLIFQLQSVNNTALWVNDFDMKVGMIRIDQADGSQWLCRVSHTSAALPTTFVQERDNNPTFWIRFQATLNPRAAWQNSTVYAYWDIAYESATGIIAVCVIPHTSSPTPAHITNDAANWIYLAQFVPATSAATLAYDDTLTGLGNNVQTAIDTLGTRETVLLKRISVGRKLRWQFGIDTGSVESGSNAGSDFLMNRFADNESFLGTAFQVNRATGLVTFSTRPFITGSGTLGSMAFKNDVATVDIQDGAVTNPKLASNAVTTVKIADSNVTDTKLASDAVTTVKIANGAVTLAKMASDAANKGKAIGYDPTTGAPAALAITAPLLHVREETGQGVNSASTFTLATWNKQVLSTIVTNEIGGSSLATSQITLPAGTYFVEGYAVGFTSGSGASVSMKSRLRDVTNNATKVVGGSFQSFNQTGGEHDRNERVPLSGRFTLAGTANLELQMWVAVVAVSAAHAAAGAHGEVEVYANLQISRVG